MIGSYIFLSLFHFEISNTFLVGLFLILFSLLITSFLPNEPSREVHKDRGEKKSFTKGKILLPLIGIFIIAGGLMQERGESVFQIGLEHSSIAVGLFGVVYAVAKIGSLLGSYLSTFFISFFGKKKTIVWSAAMQSITFFLLIFIHPLFSALALFLFFFIENIYRIAYKSIIAVTVPKKWLTSSFSLVSLGGSFCFTFHKNTHWNVFGQESSIRNLFCYRSKSHRWHFIFLEPFATQKNHSTRTIVFHQK
jgi:MFS family permease